MRGVYTAEIKLSAWASVKGMILITVPSTIVIEFLSADVMDVGTNVTNQQLEAIFARVATLGSPVGTGITPNPEEAGDQASGCTVTGGLTTDVSAYGVNYDHKGFASLSGYHYDPIPEERAVVAPGKSAIIALKVAPTAFDAVVQVKWREIG